MILKLVIFFLFSIISVQSKSQNDFSEIKLTVKLNSNNLEFKEVGEDQIIHGTVYGDIDSTTDINFKNTKLECDLIGRSYKGRGFSCGFAVIEDMQGICNINENTQDILIVDWSCNTTGGISGDPSCSGKFELVRGFGKFAGIEGFGKINMPLAKAMKKDVTSYIDLNISIKYPLSLNKE